MLSLQILVGHLSLITVFASGKFSNRYFHKHTKLTIMALLLTFANKFGIGCQLVKGITFYGYGDREKLTEE